MKRTLDCLSFPSPENSDISEYEAEYLSKTHLKKLKVLEEGHEFIKSIDDCLFEVIHEDGSKSLKKYVHIGNLLVLIFFGTRTDFLLPIKNQFNNIKRIFKLDIYGVSSNLHSNDFNFPLINDSKISKKLNVLDPIGGGVYPRDVIMIFDSNGRKRFEIPIKINGRYDLNQPIDQIILEYLEDLQSEMML